MSQPKWTILLQQEKCPLGSLVEIGEIHASRGGMVRFRRLQRYAFVLILRGEGHYDDELGRSRSLTAGDWILVLPEFGHCYTPWKRGGWDELYVMFEGPVFEVWKSSGLLSPSHLTGHLSSQQDWLREFRESVLDPASGSLEKLCAFQGLLGQAIQGSDQSLMETTDRPGWFAEACRLLSQPHAKPRDVATRLGLSYESFRRRFRQLAGVAPQKFHLSQMLNSAARLLDSTDLKSAEIARTLGFCDEAYFSRAFKKEKGRSPRTYRRNQSGT
jgi:AraC family transcriptional regulator, arabinose operon regulatory protein